MSQSKPKPSAPQAKPVSQAKSAQRDWDSTIFSLHPRMREVIKEDPSDDLSFICLICERNNSRFCGGLLKNKVNHYETNKSHLSFMEKAGIKDLNDQILNAFKKKPEEAKDNTTSQLESMQDKEQSKKLKMEITKFIITERLPYSISQSLCDFIKLIIQNFSREEILDLSVSRTTVSRIARYCFGDTLKKDILQKMRLSPFSLAIDESSDRFGSSYIAIYVKFLDSDSDSDSEPH
jgi:hypothetical protein